MPSKYLSRLQSSLGLDQPQDFWGISLPPADWRAGLLSCRTYQLVKLSKPRKLLRLERREKK
jgi:hypothetical protein